MAGHPHPRRLATIYTNNGGGPVVVRRDAGQSSEGYDNAIADLQTELDGSAKFATIENDENKASGGGKLADISAAVFDYNFTVGPHILRVELSNGETVNVCATFAINYRATLKTVLNAGSTWAKLVDSGGAKVVWLRIADVIGYEIIGPGSGGL